jgi:ABC-type multidrug transport system ATPase subunit
VKGVSGGERKRTSIGVELITNPSLIFLDEPTTGLDSYTATQVMKLLKNLSQQGRTIIQTIHQPNSETFRCFDKLMLLAQGQIIYFNDKDKAVDYFSKIGFPCPELSNPADYFMSIMSIESIETKFDEVGF